MKTYNSLDMKGRLFDYSLEAKDVDGKEVIAGDLKVEVDQRGTVVTVGYYVNAVTKDGKLNKNYGILESMLAGNYKTVVNDGEDASWIGVTGNIDVSYFVGKNSSDGELIRSQKLRGGFINDNKDKKYMNKWKLDFLITNVKEINADEEKNIDEQVKVSGYLIDGYQKRLMEVQFLAFGENARNYIISSIGSLATEKEPYFVSTWGSILKTSRLVVRKNAFGEDEQEEYDSFKWSIDGMNPEPYVFGDEAAITQEEYAAFKETLDAFKETKNQKAEPAVANLAF